jgi:enterochelin esterase-like enzyme
LRYAPRALRGLLTVPLLLAACASFSFAWQAAPAGAPAAARGPQGPVVVSPEILSDRRVTFRILAPEAQTVGLRGGDIRLLASAPGGPPNPGPAFTKGENGVWEATIGPIDPGAYRYTFTVDGVAVMDPRNPSVSESNNNAWSLLYIPGAEFMDEKNVPHGAVASVSYYSTALGKFRRMHVYTPPGYEGGGPEKYPVFYLLHGASDCDDSWTSVGRAGFIFDNLISGKKAKPMIVVMPAGHTTRTTPARGAAAAGGQAPRDEFYDDFVTDIQPYVEKNYRTLHDRAHTAIAGLSMGGGQTLHIAFTHLEQFAYVGVFSSGIFGRGTDVWEKNHLADLDDAGLKKGLKLVWFSTGSDDSLLPTSKTTVELLKKHGFDASFQESSGAHTWINWRNYLNEFTPQLFQ